MRSAASSCCGESCPPSAKPDTGRRHTASGVGPSCDSLADGRSEDTRPRPASDTLPSTPGRLPRWRIDAETQANSSETQDAARAYTTYGALLKQPDKHVTIYRSYC